MSDLSFSAVVSFQCQCGQPIYFRNNQCLHCGKNLAYDPAHLSMLSLSPGEQASLWYTDTDQRAIKRCSNHPLCDCNWLLEADDPHDLCRSCRLTRTIPDLRLEENRQRWIAIEQQKRRMLAQLLRLKLPIPSKEEQALGLAFDLLGEDSSGDTPLTGHDHGLITLNIKEADDDYRAQVREAMNEPYRTLLGHFRHEVGHFYWDLLIANSHWLAEFRQLFGDETRSYQEALDAHYQQGGNDYWQEHFISAYAAMHPWEDWAESWAHYLHIMDTLLTAEAFGMQLKAGELDLLPFDESALSAPGDPEAAQFLTVINRWVELAAMLNALARSMGQEDTYPFALSHSVVGKLQFIHRVVREAAQQASITVQSSPVQPSPIQPEPVQPPPIQPEQFAGS